MQAIIFPLRHCEMRDKSLKVRESQVAFLSVLIINCNWVSEENLLVKLQSSVLVPM